MMKRKKRRARTMEMVKFKYLLAKKVKAMSNRNLSESKK